MSDLSSDERMERLHRVLRRYADSELGVRISDHFAEMAIGHIGGLEAFEPGSDDRTVQGVVGLFLSELAAAFADARLEIGRIRLAGVRWLEDLEPDDFRGEGR